jgi:hypothetical protein
MIDKTEGFGVESLLKEDIQNKVESVDFSQK